MKKIEAEITPIPTVENQTLPPILPLRSGVDRQTRNQRIIYLRGLGKGNKEIIEITGLPRGTIQGVLAKARLDGKIPRLRSKRRSREEIEVFNTDVHASYVPGKSRRQIALELGTNVASIDNALSPSSQNPQRKREKTKLTNKNRITIAAPYIPKVKELRDKGFVITEISKRLGIPERTVRYILHGLIPPDQLTPLPKRAPTVTKRDLEVKNLTDQRLSNREVGHRLGINRSTVSKHNVKLRKLGIIFP